MDDPCGKYRFIQQGDQYPGMEQWNIYSWDQNKRYDAGQETSEILDFKFSIMNNNITAMSAIETQRTQNLNCVLCVNLCEPCG